MSVCEQLRSGLEIFLACSRILYRCLVSNDQVPKAGQNCSFAMTRSVICCLLCGALVAPALAVAATPADGRQAQIEALQVPELDAGFHLLYELKPAEAHAQFEAWLVAEC